MVEIIVLRDGGRRQEEGEHLRMRTCTHPQHVLRDTAVLRGGAVDVMVAGASLDGLILPRGEGVQKPKISADVLN